MKERISKKVVIAGVVLSALGASACGKESSQSADLSACDGGLPPVQRSGGNSFTFQFPSGCKIKSVGVYDPGKSLKSENEGELRAGEAFQIVCQNTDSKPPSIRVRSLVPAPAFEGLVNLSTAAAAEFANTNVCVVPACGGPQSPTVQSA